MALVFAHSADPSQTITCSVRGSAEAVLSRAALPIVSCVYSGPDRQLREGMYRTQDGAFEFDCTDAAAKDDTCNLRRTMALPAASSPFKGGMLVLTDCGSLCTDMFPSASASILEYEGRAEEQRPGLGIRKTADPWLRDSFGGVAAGTASRSRSNPWGTGPMCMRPLLDRNLRVPILSPGAPSGASAPQ